MIFEHHFLSYWTEDYGVANMCIARFLRSSEDRIPRSHVSRNGKAVGDGKGWGWGEEGHGERWVE